MCATGPAGAGFADRASRVIIASPLALNIAGREQVRHMPSLVRFLVVVGVLGGIVYGGLYLMAVFFEPEPKETSTTVQGVRIPR
jgi:drug/metabolite transporter (DMT)-like permease